MRGLRIADNLVTTNYWCGPTLCPNQRGENLTCTFATRAAAEMSIRAKSAYWGLGTAEKRARETGMTVMKRKATKPKPIDAPPAPTEQPEPGELASSSAGGSTAVK